MNKLQIMLVALAVVVLIAGGVVLNTDIAMATLGCGDICSGYTCPTVCTSCAVHAWCCNGTKWVRCHIDDDLCPYAWCQT